MGRNDVSVIATTTEIVATEFVNVSHPGKVGTAPNDNVSTIARAMAPATLKPNVCVMEIGWAPIVPSWGRRQFLEVLTFWVSLGWIWGGVWVGVRFSCWGWKVGNFFFFFWGWFCLSGFDSFFFFWCCEFIVVPFFYHFVYFFFMKCLE